jgi:SnoaL-like polyketide cyclase
MQGRQPVHEFLVWMHTQAFDAHPKVKTLVVGDGQTALEADFVGIHTGEFLGMAATGKSVQVPYCVVYDLRGDRIAALRAYIPWSCSPNSSSELYRRFGPPSGNVYSPLARRTGAIGHNCAKVQHGDREV